jgi:hypothetical protein
VITEQLTSDAHDLARAPGGSPAKPTRILMTNALTTDSATLLHRPRGATSAESESPLGTVACGQLGSCDHQPVASLLSVIGGTADRREAVDARGRQFDRAP